MNRNLHYDLKSVNMIKISNGRLSIEATGVNAEMITQALCLLAIWFSMVILIRTIK